ncbi:hypothetical protein, partial [Pseudomonas avellanae]|uniref:hypothetical protein n=1 Tax=Pseudomonas avellanae TaxID=46257 RepID=UPI001E63C94D
TGLLTFSGVFGVGEGHLFHRRGSVKGVGVFCQIRKPFSEFPLGSRFLRASHIYTSPSLSRLLNSQSYFFNLISLNYMRQHSFGFSL